MSKRWYSVILGASTTIITTIKPAIAEVSATNEARNAGAIVYLAELGPGVLIIIGLGLTFNARNAIVTGEKAFNAYLPSLIIFLLGIFTSCLFGFVMGALDQTLIFLIVVNTYFLIVYLIYAWKLSSLE